jgi:hypothetical protein
MVMSVDITVPGRAAPVAVPYTDRTMAGDVIRAALKSLGADAPATVRGLGLRGADAKLLKNGASITEAVSAVSSDSGSINGLPPSAALTLVPRTAHITVTLSKAAAMKQAQAATAAGGILPGGTAQAPPPPAATAEAAATAAGAPPTACVIETVGHVTFAQLVAHVSTQLGVPAAQLVLTDDDAGGRVIDRAHDDATPLWRAGIAGRVWWTAEVEAPVSSLVVRVTEGAGASPATASSTAAAAVALVTSATEVTLSVTPSTTVGDVTAALGAVPQFVGARLYFTGDGGALTGAPATATLRSLRVRDGAVQGATAYRGVVTVAVTHKGASKRLPVTDATTGKQLTDAASEAFGLPVTSAMVLQRGTHQLGPSATVPAEVGPSKLCDCECGPSAARRAGRWLGNSARTHCSTHQCTRILYHHASSTHLTTFTLICSDNVCAETPLGRGLQEL